MTKNNAFKSFLSVLFLLVGLFAYANSSNAEIISQNLYSDSIFNPNDYGAGMKTAIFAFQPVATVSIGSIIIWEHTDTGSEATNNIYIDQINCADGTHKVGEIPNANSTTYNYIYGGDVFAAYTYNWNTKPELYPNNCYGFILTNSGGPAYILTSSTGGVVSPYVSTLARSNFGSSNETYLNPSTVKHTLYGNNAVDPEISIYSPPGNVEINSLPFDFGFRATWNDANFVEMNFSLLNEATAATTAWQYILDAANNGVDSPYTATRSIDTATCNGTYTLNAIITDHSTGLFDLATRQIVINITNNPNVCEIEEDYCANFTGTFDNPICQVAVFLFKPSPLVTNYITDKKNELKNNPIVNIMTELGNSLTGYTASATNTYDIIPTFIDDFFQWIWWICFILACYKIGSHFFSSR